MREPTLEELKKLWEEVNVLLVLEQTELDPDKEINEQLDYLLFCAEEKGALWERVRADGETYRDTAMSPMQGSGSGQE